MTNLYNALPAPLYDVTGRIYQPGDLILTSDTEQSEACVQDTTPADAVNYASDTLDIAAIAALTASETSIALLQNILQNSQDSALVSAAETQLAAFGALSESGPQSLV